MLNKNHRSEAEYHLKCVLQLLGHNLSDEGLKDTPKRYVKFLEEYTYPKPFKFTTFKAPSRGMIVMSNIPVNSLCAHHLSPFWGFATVGYIPDERMAGLSKLARTVKYFAHRLQTQEQLTKQVLDMLVKELNPLGVGVIIRANHTCMCSRGAEVQDVWTTTTELYGAIEKDATSRAEFQGHHSYRRSNS